VAEGRVATTRVFQSGGGLAVSLPEECQFEGDEVCVKKIGDLLLLFPKGKEWEVFMRGVNGFSDDFGVERTNDAPTGEAAL
jgi:antitoxin VapB